MDHGPCPKHRLSPRWMQGLTPRMGDPSFGQVLLTLIMNSNIKVSQFDVLIFIITINYNLESPHDMACVNTDLAHYSCDMCG